MKTLSRRAVLRGAGGTAIALPLLEAMTDRSAAAATPPRRILLFMTANGTVRSQWLPMVDGSNNITAMSTMMAPLEPFKKKITMLDGVDMISALTAQDKPSGADVGHQIPKMHMLTGKSPAAASDGVGGISIDQEIARQIGAATKFRSIELGVQVVETPMASLGPKTFVQPINDPKTAFAKFFMGVTPGGPAPIDPAVARLQKRRQSILDYIKPDYDRLKVKVGSADAKRIDTHLASIREIERSLAVTLPTPAAGCYLPDMSKAPIDKTKGNVAGPNTDFMPTGYAHMDLLAAAITCDLTRVASLQWAGTGVYAPFLGPTFNTDHHSLSHEADGPIITIQNWFAKHFAYLAQKLDSVSEGSGTVLDNTALVWLSDIANGGHTRYDIPFVIAGGGGGYIKTGRLLSLNPKGDHSTGWNPTWARGKPWGPSHNNLFLSFMDMMGAQGTTFGDPQFCTGPIALS